MSVINCHLINTSRPLPSRIQFISTLHPKYCTSAKTFSLSVGVHHFIFLVNKKKSFCCICGEVVSKSQEICCGKLWEDLRHCILYVRSEIWIKFGCRPFVAPKVQELWQAMDETKFCLFQANISENILGQVEKRNFRWCTNLTTIREPRLRHKIKCYRMKRLGCIWQRLQKVPM